MKQEFIDLKKVINEILPEVLVKDLQDNERVCPTCKGLGIKIVKNEFGLHGDTSERAKKERFPYHHESLNFCPNCFNGVQKLCKYCGKPIKKGYTDKCDCKGYLREQEAIRLEKWNEILDKAEEVKEEDITNMLYCEETEEYYASVGDFLEDWECDHDEEDEMPERLWVTVEQSLSLNADNILENACDDLHEDAYDQCDIDELQVLLDKYATKQTGTKTYYPSYKQYVKIK